jgi:hypothetical protein
MNRQQLEEKIDDLIREYYKNQDPEIPEQILELVPVDHGRPDGRIITPAFLLISRRTNNP